MLINNGGDVMIILDFSSGNTCKNDIKYIERMIDELKAVDTGKHEVVIKWQLFQEVGENIPLKTYQFHHAYKYAALCGYKTTASVFDKFSLDFLLDYKVPFVKIANRPDLYWLAGEVPRKIPVIRSTRWGGEVTVTDTEVVLCCISEYPAETLDYIANFTPEALSYGISDHTTTFELYNKYTPEIYECHYKLSDSTGLDAGPFARTPEQLAEIL
jgi:sialic acid synthase SpsE